MSKKYSKNAEIEYHRQGSIDDENFIYLFNKIENLETTINSAIEGLSGDLKSSLSTLSTAVGNVGSNVSSNISEQTTQLKTDLESIATAITNQN